MGMTGTQRATNGNGQRGATERPSQAITRAESDKLTPQAQVEALFRRAADRLDKMMPGHLKAERIWRLALAAMSRDSKLTEATPQSILLATMQCAALGLEPSTALQQAYLVPFNNKKSWKEGNEWREKWVTEAQLIIGYRGYILLAEQAGVVSSPIARIVHTKDDYLPALEGGEFKHIPFQDGDPGPLKAAYCRWFASNGQKEYFPMSAHELNRHRDRFAKRDRNSNSLKRNQPWVTDFEAMCSKTTVRQSARFWPMATERSEKLRTALALDERADAGVADFKTGLTEDMQSALHELPEMRETLEYEPEPDYPTEGEDEPEIVEAPQPTAARTRSRSQAQPSGPDPRGPGAIPPEEEARLFDKDKKPAREPGED